MLLGCPAGPEVRAGGAVSALRAGGSCARAGLCGADAGSQVTGLMASCTEQEGVGGESQLSWIYEVTAEVTEELKRARLIREQMI